MRLRAVLLLTLLASVSAQIDYDAGSAAGRITYYDQTPTVACDIPDSLWPPYTAALSELQFAGGLACGATARLSNNGKTIDVMVVDLCPKQGNEQWCSGDLPHFDLGGAAAFGLLEPVSTGVKVVSFEWFPTPVGETPVRLRYKDGVNRWWVAIQVLNHRYPVANLEILENGSTTWIAGNRTRPGMWNYWQFDFPRGLEAPYRIRITDQYGQVIEEGGIAVLEYAVWEGINQFPLLPRHAGAVREPGPSAGTVRPSRSTAYVPYDPRGRRIPSDRYARGLEIHALRGLAARMYLVSPVGPRCEGHR